MKKVLVVEDDLPICWLLENILSHKYDVVVKNNGMEAYSWLSRKNIPDLILSDIKMPVMDGVELLENLTSSGLYRNIPVIILTGFDDPGTRKRCMDMGAFAYLEKPFKPKELMDKISEPFISKMFS
jgi:two-component system chemotaxis response regulator CheY